MIFQNDASKINEIIYACFFEHDDSAKNFMIPKTRRIHVSKMPFDFQLLPLGNGEVCTSCENQASEKQPKFTRRSKKNTVKKW